MDGENQNTRSRVHAVNPPPPIKTDFRQALLDLTGLDCNGPVADEAAQAMLACHMQESEILAIFYLRSVECLRRVLNNTLTRAVEDKPLSVWDAAQQVRNSAQCDLAKRLEHLRNQYRNSRHPEWSSPEFTRLPLNPDCSYSLTNDIRNPVDLMVLVGPEGIVKALAPGATLNLKGVDVVEVQSSVPCLMKLVRTGGQYRTGSLGNCLPLPRKRLQKPVEPPKPKAKRFGWF